MVPMSKATNPDCSSGAAASGGVHMSPWFCPISAVSYFNVTFIKVLWSVPEWIRSASAVVVVVLYKVPHSTSEPGKYEDIGKCPCSYASVWTVGKDVIVHTLVK